MARLQHSLNPSSNERYLNFHQFAAAGLILNLFVILWGAYVRASGSGAGCGQHWPLCNGQILPQSPQLHTIIEFIHRLSSGMCLVFAVILYGWSRRRFPKGHLARNASGATLAFTLSEAIVGAGLVLFALVAHDQSAARAFSISIHLVNTLILLACLTLAYRWSHIKPDDRNTRLSMPAKLGPWLIGSLVSLTLLGITGALTALGDTLFKSKSLSAGMAQDFAKGSHFLIKLRILHPALAVVTAALLLLLPEICERTQPGLTRLHRPAKILQALVLVQLAFGALNLTFLAPTWMQLTHLLLADTVWICLVLLAASAFETTAETA
ncbi:MAG: COX15/CtaA family protein [Oligoflexia bacterium]|nr:COX15/CtaA family protein [Oligoflexia bacterium]